MAEEQSCEVANPPGAVGRPLCKEEERKPVGLLLTGRTAEERTPTSECEGRVEQKVVSPTGIAIEARRGKRHPPPGRPPGSSRAVALAGPGQDGQKEAAEELSRVARSSGDGTQTSGRPPAAGKGHGSSRRW